MHQVNLNRTHAPLAPRRPGLLSGQVEESFFDPLPDDEIGAWER